MPTEQDEDGIQGGPENITPRRINPQSQPPKVDASDFASQPPPPVASDSEPPERLTPPQEPELLNTEDPNNDYENISRAKKYSADLDRYNIAAEKQRVRDAWKTQKRSNNQAAQADSQQTGRQYEYDDNGLAQPKIDPETGQQAVKERVHPVRYDEKGRPYQVVYNEGGKAPETVTNPDGTSSQVLSKKIANPDADAEIGANPDDPNDPNLYRKNKNSQWSVIDPKEGIHDSDNRVAIASAKHLHKLEMRDISNRHADLGLKIQQLRRGFASEDSDQQADAGISGDASTPAPTIPTGGLSPKARKAQEDIVTSSTESIPEPKPVTGIFGANQEATAKARAEWQAQEQQRKAGLDRAQKLIATDDQIKVARSGMLDLSLKHQALKEEGPAGYMKRLREERRNSIASMDPDSAKGAIEDGVKQIGVFDQDIQARSQELQKRTEAIAAKRQQGGTAAQIADLDKEAASLQADSQELSKSYEQRNDLARRLQAGAQKLQKDQEDKIQAQRNELRKNPATVSIADQLDQLDVDTKDRKARLDSQEFPDDASRQAAHDALEADIQAKHDALNSSAQDALKADFDQKQKADSDLTTKAKRRMELEKGIKDAEASDILTAGDSAPLSESPTIAKNKEELAKMDAEEGGAAVKSRQAELEEDDKKLTFKDGKGYAVLHDGNVVINPAALRPEGLRPDGMPSWQEQIAQAKQEGHLNDAQAAALSKRTEMNAKIMQEGIVDKTLINDQFRDWIVRNALDLLKRVSPSTTQKDLETPGFLPDFTPENQKDLQELRDKALEFLKEKPSLMEKIADFGNKFTHELIPATVGSLATAAGVAINAGGYAKNSLGDWLQDVGLGVEALKEQTMDPRLAGSASGTIAEHAGGLAGFLIPSALVGRAARAAGMGEKAAMALSQIATGGVGAAQNASAIYREARDMGKTEKEAFLPFVLAGVVGAGVVIPVSHYLNTFAEPVKNEITKGLVKTLGEAVSFASLNTGTTLANNAIAQRIYDENRDLFQGVAQSAESGAISGSILGLISAAVGGAKTARLRTKYGIPQGWSGKIEDLAAADQQIGAIHTQPTAKDLSKQRAELQKRLSIATPDEAPVIQAQVAMINEAIKVDPANVPLEARGDLASALIKLSQGTEFQNLSETERAAAGKAKSTAGVAFIEDQGGKVVISETAKQWLENTAPHAAKVIRAADGAESNENPPSSQQQGTPANPPGENAPAGSENRPPAEAPSGRPEVVGGKAAGNEQIQGAGEASEPAPLGDDAPMPQRKERAKTMWDRAQVGDIYHSPDAFGGNYRIEIKANRDGSRYAEITGESGAFIDSIQFDKDPESALKGLGLIHGQDMTRVKRGESIKGAEGGEEEPPAAPVGGKSPLNPRGDGGAAAAAEPSAPRESLKPSTKRGRALSKVLQTQGVDPEVADHYAALKDAEYGTGKSEDVRAKILEDFEKDGGVFPGRLQQENESPEYWKSAFPEESPENHQAYADQAKANNEARKNEASGKNRALLELEGNAAEKTLSETGSPSRDGGATSIPSRPEVRPLTNKEGERAKILSARLQNEVGVRADVADAFARQQIRDGADASAIVDNFNKAGGVSKQDEIGNSIHVAEALHDENVKSLLKKFAEQHKAASGRRLSVEQRRNIRQAIEHLAPAVARWNKAFANIRMDMKKRGSGGGEAVGMDLRINFGDILDKDFSNLQQLKNDPERAEKLLSEEAIHVLGKSILARHSQAKGRTAEEIRDAVGPVRASGVKDIPDEMDHADAEAATLFDSLPKALRDHVEGIYSETPGTLDSWQLGHEFLRMLAQHDLEMDTNGRVSADGKVISEQTLEKGIIDQIRDHLAKLFAYLSKLSENLRSGGASEKDISHVEGIRSQLREAIKSLRSEIDLNRNEAYQKAYEDRRAAAGKERSAVAPGRSENNPAGVAVGGGTQGGGLEGVYGAVPGTGNNGSLDKPSGQVPEADGGKPDAGNVGQTPGATTQREGVSGVERQELEKLRAEKAEREAAAERAEQRRNSIVQKQAENTADKEKLLAKVPEEAKGPASDLLQKVHMGDATYVLGANREKLPAVYIAAPPSEVQTSHAGEDFHKNPNYGGENTRNYHNDETEQNKVRQMALPGGLDEDTIVTDAKSAADGSPQVVITIFNDAEGNMQVRLQTAGGNGREQGINLSSPEDQERLSAAWKAKEGQFGLQGMPEGWRGYRLLGVYDLRDEAQNRAYLQLVDKLNPNQGVVQDTASRADIDAALKIPVDRLVDLPITMSPKAATDALAGLIRDAEKLGLDRNLMAGLLKNPTQAQFYMQRLMLAAAFRSRPLSEFFAGSQMSSGHATVVGLIRASGETALKLRKSGHGNIAEAIGRTLETIADYVNRGEKIGMAIKKAADQVEMGEDGPLIQAIASALEKKVAYFPIDKKGIKKVDSEASIAGFEDLMRDIGEAMKHHSDEPDIFGQSMTLGQTIASAINAHFAKLEREAGSSANEEPGALQSRRAQDPIKRMRQLMRKRSEEGLNRYETEELTRLEKAQGQHFMGFFDEARNNDFSLEGQREEVPSAPTEPASQMGLFARKAGAAIEKSDLQAYLDFSDVPEEKRPEAEKAFAAFAKASSEPYSLPDAGGMDRDKLRQARERQAAAYRGLLKGDAEAVRKAIKEGIPLSKLIEGFTKREIAPFSIQGAIINSPADLAAHSLAHRTPFFESLKVAVLDNSNQVVHSEIVSIGSLNEAVVHPREVMRAVDRGKEAAKALGRGIQGWMVMHNHPGGDPSPSEADKRITRRLDEVAAMMDAPLIDHVITNGETYFSFHQAGLKDGGVSLNPKAQPKLQIIPKPDGMAPGAMADFEAVPASEANEVGKVNSADHLQNIRAVLQTADPGMIHVLHLNTRLGLIAVERIPLESDPATIFKSAARYGSYGVALSFPDSSPKGVALDTQGAVASWRPFVKKAAEHGTAYQVPLFDASTKEFSWRAAGLLETPSEYKTSANEQIGLLSRRAGDSESKKAAEELKAKIKPWMADAAPKGEEIQPKGGKEHKKAIASTIKALSSGEDGSFERPDIGTIHIPLGSDGTENKRYENGSGLNGIITKRMIAGEDPVEAVVGAINAAALGRVHEIYGPNGHERASIDYNGYRAILSLTQDGNEKAWILTGYEIQEGGAKGVSRNLDRYAPADSYIRRKVVASSIERLRQELENVNPEKGSLMSRRAGVDESGFYSKLERVIDQKIQGKQVVAQSLKALIAKSDSGIKPEEIKWSGISDIIDTLASENGGKVPKQALMDYLQGAGRVRFEERELSAPRADQAPKDSQRIAQKYGFTSEYDPYNDAYTFTDKDGEDVDFQDLPGKMQTELVENTNKLDRKKAEPKFRKYTVPGGENYREIVLTMPSKETARYNELQELAKRRELPAEFVSELAQLKEKKNDYTSSHFSDIPNYVAHMRLDERKDASGRDGLFIEEIQSDRHQQGREKGYDDNRSYEKELEEISPKVSHALSMMDDLGFDRQSHAKMQIIQYPDYAERWEIDPQYRELLDRYREIALQKLKASNAIPDAPFRKDWSVQMLKRALRDAIAGEKDWIGWTSGETQAERYDLSKQVDALRYTKMSDGLYKVKFIPKGRNGEWSSLGVLKENDLADNVGKEIADKITKGEGEKDSFSGATILRGIDLKVGGEGMKGFYDQILPKEIGKYVKQWGAKVEQGYLDPSNPAVRGLSNDDEATGVAIGARPVWKIDITPEMRESIQNEGQSLFARRAERSGQPDLFDDQLDLFAHARKEADAYNDALEKDGITHPEAKTEAAMQDLGLSANQAEDLFARNEQTSENPQQDAPTTNPSQIGSKLVDGEPGSELSLSGEPSPKKSGKIEDFGEKITGAKKDLWQRFEQSINADLPEDSKEISLSKHFPEPDYAKLIEAGFDPERLAAMKAIRDLVPRKPSHPYKLRRWAELVRTLHKTMQQFASKESNVSNEFMWEASEKAGGGIFSKVMLYKELGYPAFLHAKDWEVEQRRGSTMWDRQGNKIVTPDQMVTRAEHNGRMTDILTTNPDRLAAFKEIADKIKAKIEEQMLQQPDSAPRELKLDVYRDTRTGEYFIGRKGLNGVIRLKSGFTSAKEAMTFREDNKADLSRLWEDMTKEPETRGKINAPRQGPDRRQGDVSPDQFNDAFGFRGVQFGNYVEGERRQADLNHSFDALMDLAEALGVPPKALSLDGQLGLAFGARGHGNALAHYEPTQVVINLTKKGGPGSLAHEWFHAADHYFSNLDKTGKTDWSGRAAAYATEKSSGASAGNLRPEVAEAFQGIRQAMENNGFAERSKTLDAAKSKPYWSKIIEKAARAFESYVIDRLGKSGVTNDYLANVRSESGAYPKAEELDGGIRAAFDHLFETLDTRETDRGASLFSRRAGKVENDRFKAEEDGLKSPAARLEESRDLLNAEAARFSDMPGYDAKEALQKARIAVANAAKAYDPSRGVPFQAYAREAARNALRDLYRKEALHAERFPESLDASQSEGSPDQAPSPLDQAVAREREKVLAGAISELPAKMQEVVRASLEGSSLQEIADRMGISKTAAHKLLEVAQRRLRGKLGEKGISDAGSLLSRSAGRSGIDQDKIEGLRQEAEREDQQTAPKKIGRPDLAFGANGPETRAVDDYYSENAPRETRDEWEDEAQALLGGNEEATRKEILRKGLNGGSLTPSETIAAGIIADRLRRAMQADPSAENKRAFNLFWYAYRSTGSVVARALASRNDPYMRPAERYRSFLIDMMTKPSKAARKAIEAEKDPTKKASMIDEETRRVMEKLRAAGITPEDIFKDRVTLRLADKKITSEFRSLLSRSTGNQEARRAAFDMLLKNKSLEAISKATGLRPQEIQSIKDAFVAKMRQDHFAKFQAGAKADQTSVITGKKVDDAVAEREFKKWLENLGIVSDERQGKPRFNIEDPAHIMRMASAIREARGDATLLDKAYELWVMNILSAPATHVANITGNLGSSALNLTLQRGMESLVNLAVRDEKSAQIGEFQYLMKGLMPGISKGYAMAAKAWSAEHDFFEHTVLGTPLELAQLDKTGNSRQAISGAKGKLIRIPGRALLFADSMFKTAIGQMEAGAMAYRMAKAEGLTGQKLADRIAVLSKTRGEVVADNLAKANVSKEAVKWFAERLAGRDETLDADELVEDHGSDAWQLAREQAAYDMAKKSGWKEDAWQNAVKSAREMTFQQDLKKAKDGGNFIEDMAAKLQDARNDNPLLGVLFPFVKTPYNIFRVGIRKSPLGAINLATQAAKGLYSVKNGKLYIEGHPEAVRDLAEQAIAWGAMALLWGAAQGDEDDDSKQLLITGSHPRSVESTGIQGLNERAFGGEYVVRIGGRNGITIPYGRLEPIATVLGTTIDLIRGIKRNGTTQDNMQALWGYMLDQANGKTFLSGASTISDMARGKSNPLEAAKKSFLQALVPNLIRSPLRALDDYIRDSKHAGPLYTMLPASDLAEEQINPYGEAVKKSGNPLLGIFFNTPVAADETLKSADKLLLNWNRSNPSEAWAPQPPKAEFKDAKGKTQAMSSDETKKFRLAAGRIASARLRSVVTPRAAANPTKEDLDAVKKVFEQAGHEAKSRIFNPAYLTRRQRDKA